MPDIRTLKVVNKEGKNADSLSHPTRKDRRVPNAAAHRLPGSKAAERHAATVSQSVDTKLCAWSYRGMVTTHCHAGIYLKEMSIQQWLTAMSL